MNAMELKKDFYWVGVQDKDLRVFDIIMQTEFGTTYNSYVLKGSEKTALFETAKDKFFDSYIATVSQITDISSIEYIIVDHTEPDHAGSIERILDLNPTVKIIGTAGAIGFLKQIVNRDFYSITAKNGTELSLGDKTLRFFVLPNLHWPDTMYTYIEEDKILITCDSFGAHYTHDGVLRSNVEDTDGYMRAAKYYFDNILGPFKQPYMEKALDIVRKMDIAMICPGHGPVLDSNIPEFLDVYEQWCKIENPNSKKTVIMPYVSAYGYTEMLAKKIAEGVKDSGDIDVRMYDLVESNTAEVLEEINYADGLLFGTPTILNDALKPVWDLTTCLYPPVHGGKYASAFGSYGWSGEGVPNIIERLKMLKMKVMDGFKIRFKPSQNEQTDAYEFGYAFGCFMQNKKDERKKGGRKLVKCLVCGEIFDSSLDVCPVCGVGSENFAEVNADESTYKNNTKEIFLILGGGIAALNAATAIRERNTTCSIVMAFSENALPYNRPMLTKNLLAGLAKDSFAIHDEKWYEDNGIYIMPEKTVSELLPEKKEAVMTDGNRFSYDKCIYALGARSFIPPIENIGLPQVAAIRNLEDVAKATQLAKPEKKAVVIGGGVLGLEAAWELKKIGCSVSVLEALPVLMAGKLDESVSSILAEIAEKNGIKITTDAKVAKIEGENQVTGVALADGTILPADFVILSCGIRPNIEIAVKAGITAGKALAVNENMQTNIKDIYACGDCAGIGGENHGIWPEASLAGTVAGANAAGETLVYTPVSPAITINAMNTTLYTVGSISFDKPHKTIEFKDPTKHSVEKYYFTNNRLCGAVLLGDVSKLVQVTELIEKGAGVKDIL